MPRRKMVKDKQKAESPFDEEIKEEELSSETSTTSQGHFFKHIFFLIPRLFLNIFCGQLISC